MNKLDRKNDFWNILGILIYAITRMVLGIVVTRIVGDSDGGIFFFAFSTLGQQLYIVAYFGMRPIQITDTSYNYYFKDYLFFRIITCVLALISGGIYIWIFGEDIRIKIIILMLVLYKIIDGFADCIESELQRVGKLYLAGKSIVFRTILSITVFLLVLVYTKNLLYASISFVPVLIIGVFLFAFLPLKKLSKQSTNENIEKQKVDISKIKGLFNVSKWLFISSFLDLYIFAAAKYAVNNNLGYSASTYFSTIFIPTSVINLMANFAIRPTLTKLSYEYENKRYSEFDKLVLKIFILIIILTALGMIAAGLFGIPTLTLLVGKELGAKFLPYTMALVLVILGGGFYAVLNLIYYCLVIFKKQNIIFLIYCIGSVIAFFLCDYLVIKFGIDGAAISYMFIMFIMMMLFIIGYLWERKKLTKY